MSTQYLQSTSSIRLVFCCWYCFLFLCWLVSHCKAGSCFKLRLANGYCHDLISRNGMSRENCCALGGFYVSRYLSYDNYMYGLLLHRSGIAPCNYACEMKLYNDYYREVCNNIDCVKGFTCAIIHGQPFCHCSSVCSVEDYVNKPVCTTDFKRFRNRCEFIRERCRNMDVMLEEMDCTPANQICSGAEDSDSDAPLKVCSLNEVCIVRAYSGKPSCEDPHWFEPEKYKLVIKGVKHPGRFDKILTDMDIMSGKMVKPFDEGCPNSQLLAPLCGTNNVTYINQCALRQASLRGGMEIRIAYRGSCRVGNCSAIPCHKEGKVCRHHHATGQPVCLDCNNPPNDCNPPILSDRLTLEEEAEIANYELSNEIHQVYGDPRWHGDVFTTNWPYVCGSDGERYLNTCFLHMKNCLGNRYTEMKSIGSCK